VEFAPATAGVYAAAMRSLLAAVLLVVLFASCSSTAEDRAFFSAGWMRPEQGADERLNRR